MDSALHVPQYIEDLGCILEYNTSIYEAELGVNKRIAREHSNRHTDELGKIILTRVRICLRHILILICLDSARQGAESDVHAKPASAHPCVTAYTYIDVYYGFLVEIIH